MKKYQRHSSLFDNSHPIEKIGGKSDKDPIPKHYSSKRKFDGLSHLALFVFSTVLLWMGISWLISVLPVDRMLLTLSSLFPATIASTYLMLHIPRHRPWSTLGVKLNLRAVVTVGYGIGLGACLVGSILGAHWILGWTELTTADFTGHSERSWAPTLVSGLFGIAVGSAGEELLVRGYGFHQLARTTHPWMAVVVTGSIFGWMHYGNPAFSGLALVNTVLFGLLFGLALVRHRTLWLTYGMHAGWNLSLASLGINLSGLKINLTGIQVKTVGPSLWTGGAYGLEGGLSATIVVLVAAWVIWKLPFSTDHNKLLWEEE
ncbi:MAG: hypothetical protein CMN58_01185 [Solibacterales bacterium]|nr:hypothetical protein [Bryobacterales bacterium]|tara:strand:- start:2465 stop:3415 length:951 start_codon:yes stop_codon:yes gene_type:complete